MAKESQKSALVTGASGFLGSHLCKILVEKGYETYALVRNSSNLFRLQGIGVELLFGSLDDRVALIQAVSGKDYLFHCAGLISARDRGEYFRGNVDGTRRLLEAVVEANQRVKRFVYVSSLAAGGPSEGKRPNSENGQSKPITYYGESKLAGELEVLKFKDRIPVSVIRPPAIYGPSDKPTLNFFRFANWGIIPVFGKSDKYLSIVHVKDVVSAIVLSAENERAEGEVFNVSDGAVYSWLEVWRIMCEVAGKKGRIIRIPLPLFFFIANVWEKIAKLIGRPSMLNYHKAIDLTKSWAIDISKIKNVLGFKPAYSLKDGARQTYEWYKKEEWL